MKNIHILPTDKPSKKGDIVIWNGLKIWDGIGKPPHHNRNIYITNDEEIKMGDYAINSNGYLIKINQFADDELSFIPLKKDVYCNTETWHKIKHYKKIILTTDQDLIKDGVQAIDDEFLEWFVKNPSCEEVKTQRWYDGYTFGYKIIIPKEEAKQKYPTCECGSNWFNITAKNKPFCFKCGKGNKQETLEEAAENFVNSTRLRNYKVLFIEGAKWQQEQILQFLYSEITERRPYSSSKMCEKVIEFIEQLNTKK